jgi:heat shock protein HtpX
MNSTFANNAKTLILLGGLTALVMFCGSLLGGRNGVWIGLALAAVMNMGAYFFSAQLALASAGAQEVGPEHPLYKVVAQLSERASLPMPRVYVSPEQAPNAFATGRNPRHAAVCATQGLLDFLSPQEVAGVMAHELAHVKHRDILITSVAATIGGAISGLGYMFMWGGGGSSRDEDAPNPLAGLLVMLLGPLAAGLIQMAISRQREYAADTEGGQLCGDPMWLATALERIHTASQRIPMNVNPAYNSMYISEPHSAMSSMAGLFQTHPPLEKRLMNLIGRESTGRVM